MSSTDLSTVVVTRDRILMPLRYIGELMQTSKITSSAPSKKGKGRSK